MYDVCKPKFLSGELKPIIDRTYNLSEVVEAHKFIESNQSIGKVVLLNDLHWEFIMVSKRESDVDEQKK